MKFNFPYFTLKGSDISVKIELNYNVNYKSSLSIYIFGQRE